MGAIGAAMLAREMMPYSIQPTRFKGFSASQVDYRTTSFECRFCSNRCEIVQVSVNKHVVARWGGRCDRWDVNEAIKNRLSAPPAAVAVAQQCDTC